MKKFKHFFFCFLLFYTCFSCAQNKEQNNKEKISIIQMEKSIENKEEGYVYDLAYEHSDCSYEILVNDVPIITFFGLGNRSTSEYINDKILNSGKQDITIRLYPKKIGDTEFAKGLTKDSKVKITIIKEWFTADSRASDKYAEGVLKKMENNLSEIPQEYLSKWNILTFETPEIEDGQPYAEFKTSIDLKQEDINWQITGWKNGQNLRNNPNIRQEVYNFYKNFQTIVENNKKSDYLRLVSHSLYESALAEPWHSKEYFEHAIKSAKENIDVKQKFMFPLDLDIVELKFYGEGKVVTLVSTDMKSFGYSPLVAKAEYNNFPEAYTFYLYKPQGSDQLEIIR